MNAPDALILESARRLFSRRSAAELARAASTDEASELCAAIGETSLDWLLVPEECGGPGADLLDAVGTVRAAGYYAAHAPVLESIAGRWLLAAAGCTQMEGPVVLGHWREGCASNPQVVLPWGRFAKTGCVLAGRGEEHLLHVFAIDARKLERDENLAGEPRDVLRFAVANAGEVRTSAIPVERAQGLCALLRAAQISGAMQRVLEIAVEHANTRVQFGKRIGQFQAVQQLLAHLAAEVAAASAAVDAGTLLMRDDMGWLGGALAKARASEAVTRVNANAHEVVAAMGFTREFPLQLFTRRLWAWRDEDGSEHHWNERIGDVVLRVGPDKLWEFIVQPRLPEMA